ncbi:8962_t:CDS:2, partial [Racocetra fulgida]
IDDMADLLAEKVTLISSVCFPFFVPCTKGSNLRSFVTTAEPSAISEDASGDGDFLRLRTFLPSLLEENEDNTFEELIDLTEPTSLNSIFQNPIESETLMKITNHPPKQLK